MKSPLKRVRIRLATAYLKRIKRKTSPAQAANNARIKELNRKLHGYDSDIGALTLGKSVGMKLQVPTRHEKEFAERDDLIKKIESLAAARDKARARVRTIAGKPRRKYDK